MFFMKPPLHNSRLIRGFDGYDNRADCLCVPALTKCFCAQAVKGRTVWAPLCAGGLGSPVALSGSVMAAAGIAAQGQGLVSMCGSPGCVTRATALLSVLQSQNKKLRVFSTGVLQEAVGLLA